MNASPPAAATPVRNRGGIVQKMARAPLMPVTATAIQTTDIQNSPRNTIAPMNPAAATAQASARLTTLLAPRSTTPAHRSEEHTSELQSRLHLVCRLLLEKKKKIKHLYLV